MSNELIQLGRITRANGSFPGGPRCRNDNTGKFVACGRGHGLGYGELVPGIGAPRRPALRSRPVLPGLRRRGHLPMTRRMGQPAITLPIVGSIGIPKSVTLQTFPALAGIALGKVGPGLVTGILGNFLGDKGALIAKVAIGGLTALAFLSPRFRTNSYFTGFAIVVLADTLDPILQSVVDMVVPPSAAPEGLGRLTAEERRALKMAEQALMGPGLGQFRGREVMLPGDYLAIGRGGVPLSGLNDVGLRSIG